MIGLRKDVVKIAEYDESWNAEFEKEKNIC
jgi:hypothetical protein